MKNTTPLFNICAPHSVVTRDDPNDDNQRRKMNRQHIADTCKAIDEIAARHPLTVVSGDQHASGGAVRFNLGATIPPQSFLIYSDGVYISVNIAENNQIYARFALPSDMSQRLYGTAPLDGDYWNLKQEFVNY